MNTKTRILFFIFGLALILSISVPNTRAQDDNFRAKATKVTVKEAMQIPGTVLQPGEYVFRLNDSDANRHIVEIRDKDNKLVTRVLAIANERLQASDKPIMTYQERPTGQPVALEAWFYSGETLGQQFVYPKTEAAELSRLNNTKVPSTESEQAFPGETLSAQNNVSSPSGNATERGTNTSQSASQSGANRGSDANRNTNSSTSGTSTSPVPTQTPSSSDSGTSATGASRANSGTAAAQAPYNQNQSSTTGTGSAGANNNSELPKTASPLPLIAMLGSLLVAFSLLLKVVRS